MSDVSCKASMQSRYLPDEPDDPNFVMYYGVRHLPCAGCATGLITLRAVGGRYARGTKCTVYAERLRRGRRMIPGVALCVRQLSLCPMREQVY